MSRKSTISITLTLFALLSFQVQGFSFFEAHSLRNTHVNLHATSSGIIELKKDSSDSFYVEADFNTYPFGSEDDGSNSTNVSNSTNALSRSDSVKMMISLANGDSMVSTSCLKFNYYDCSKYHCYKYSRGKTIDFPDFTVSAKAAGAYVYLDYYNWGIETSDLYLAQSCSSKGDKIGSNRYGVLGLGTTNRGNFLSKTMFSIYIKPDLKKGTLMFKNDASNYAESSSPLYTLYTNSTWQLPLHSAYVKITDYSVLINGNLMFDVNSDAIGLPYDVWTLFLKYFTYTHGIKRCGPGKYRPTCYSSKKLGDLPDIFLSFNGHKLKIPSKIYATPIHEKHGEYSFYFNFKATDPSFSGKSYVTPSFKNSIILDANFMSYYYTVFDGSSSSNVVYLYPSKDPGSGSHNPAIWIASGAAAAIFLIGGLCCCCAKKKRKIVNNTRTTIAPLNATDIDNNTAQAPLIQNQQNVNDSAPTYSYDASLYNYTGYNNIPQPQPQLQPQGMYPVFDDALYQQQQRQQGIVYAPGYVQPQAQERAKQ